MRIRQLSLNARIFMLLHLRHAALHAFTDGHMKQ